MYIHNIYILYLHMYIPNVLFIFYILYVYIHMLYVQQTTKQMCHPRFHYIDFMKTHSVEHMNTIS